MKICVVGAGAIGGMMGARLALVGEEVTLIARGPHLEAIRQHGLKLIEEDGAEHVADKVKATSRLSEAGEGPIVQARMRLGYTMRVDLRSGTEYRAYYSGLYDTPLIRSALQLLRPGGTAVDAGAEAGGWIAGELARGASVSVRSGMGGGAMVTRRQTRVVSTRFPGSKEEGESETLCEAISAVSVMSQTYSPRDETPGSPVFPRRVRPGQPQRNQRSRCGTTG